MTDHVFNPLKIDANFQNELFLSKQYADDLVIFSHLRWDFVFQRPQHLHTRFARHRRVFFIEEPQFMVVERPHYNRLERDNGVQVIVPVLPINMDPAQINQELKITVDELFMDEDISDFIAWYYTPMALPFTRHLDPALTVYDCMDELSAFKNAPKELPLLETELMRLADIVFTGGQSLYEAKKNLHSNIHPFPSSIDMRHFRSARTFIADPFDQKDIPHPRLGFFGVIDERMNIDLIDEVARKRPDWHIVMIGPVVKIDPAQLPKHPNIHYLGKKEYKELPHYLAGWDVALLPFAKNESTKFISPTKTPEYLAAGRPVVSTSIRDVVRPYGEEHMVFIADTTDEFIASVEQAIELGKNPSSWLKRVDRFLENNSWEMTVEKMVELMAKAQSLVLRRENIGHSQTTSPVMRP